MMNLFLKPPKFSGNYLNNPVNNQNTNFSQDVFRQAGIVFLAQAKTALINFGASMADFFHSYKWKEIVFALKSISFVLSLLLLVAIILVIFKTMAIKKPKEGIIKNRNKQWAKIEKKIKSKVEANYKIAILEADNLFDEVLKAVGYEKEKQLSNILAIKQARKIKNKIIEDKDFKLSQDDAEIALGAYRNGLEELGVL